MSTSILYRAVAILILLYAAGHTFGFSRVDPAWGVDAPIQALKTISFSAQGTPNRTYWGFYMGFGYFCSLLLVFSAAIAWQLGSLPPATLRDMQLVSWAFAVMFALETVLTWMFFFTAPVVFSAVITVGLFAAAWMARRG